MIIFEETGLLLLLSVLFSLINNQKKNAITIIIGWGWKEICSSLVAFYYGRISSRLNDLRDLWINRCSLFASCSWPTCCVHLNFDPRLEPWFCLVCNLYCYQVNWAKTFFYLFYKRSHANSINLSCGFTGTIRSEFWWQVWLNNFLPLGRNAFLKMVSCLECWN